MDIRFATINDIDAVTELERQCFPPEEAAEKDSFEKRLTVCLLYTSDAADE